MSFLVTLAATSLDRQRFGAPLSAMARWKRPLAAGADINVVTLMLPADSPMDEDQNGPPFMVSVVKVNIIKLLKSIKECI